MKNQNVLVALIIAVAVISSALILSAALGAFGRSVEKAAASIGSGMSHPQPVASVPSAFRVDLGEIKIANGGGGGQSFRIESASK
jgi:ABC-type Na+ efflux pump permease subunit